MTEDEYRAEQAEAERLQRQINNLISQINSTIRENEILEQDLELAIENVGILNTNTGQMGNAVNEQMGFLSGVVEQASVSTTEVFYALNELSTQYFTFKNISTASKNITQFTDEYNTSFSYYNELRRIALGYVIGIDTHIVSSENMRKKVEKTYLQNTDYWLAYSISAVMLWVSDGKEAATRAMSKSLSINYFNACLFFLLVNLRFCRFDAAKKWYLNYLDKADMSNLGDEWQYLLQAYLTGAFGADNEFQSLISNCFTNMMNQIEASTVDFGNKFSKKAFDFADSFLHKTEHIFILLKRVCEEYDDMILLLSNAEKNAAIAKYYNVLAEKDSNEGSDLTQRIENVLYSLISDYDEDEKKIVMKIKYNEAVVNAKGDVNAAQAKYNYSFNSENKKQSLADLLLKWAFTADASQTDITVMRFSISLMKEWVSKGFYQYVEKYRRCEKEQYTITIDDCELICNENDFEVKKTVLENYYNKNKAKNILKDRYIMGYSALCIASLLTLLILAIVFSNIPLTLAKIALTLGIIVGLAGSFLLWRRIVDLGKILKEKKRQGVLKLKQVLEELKLWRSCYREENTKSIDLINSVNQF